MHVYYVKPCTLLLITFKTYTKNLVKKVIIKSINKNTQNANLLQQATS